MTMLEFAPALHLSPDENKDRADGREKRPSGARQRCQSRSRRKTSEASNQESQQQEPIRPGCKKDAAAGQPREFLVTLYKKTQEIRHQGERSREMDKTDNEKLLNEATARLEAEAKR